MCEAHGQTLQVPPRHPGFPRAMALRLIRALPGKRPFLPPLPAGLTANVAPGSRRQDHTTSPYAAAFRPVQAPTQQASIATRTTLRDDRANVPHGGAGWAEYCH